MLIVVLPRARFAAFAPSRFRCLGAHLITPGSASRTTASTWAQGQVIHYGALVYDIIRKPVEAVTLEQFAGGRPVFIVQHDELPYGVTEIIERARSRLGEHRYRLLTNNCEHFVEWCLYDVHRSFQVDRALNFPRFMGERVQGAVMKFLARLFFVRRAPAEKRIRPNKT